jgi:hypothetical protein
MRRLLTSVLALTTLACATQKEQRSTARMLALHAQTVQTDLQKFADKRAVANQARQRSINVLERSRLQRENQNDERVRTWQISDPARLALFRGVVAATDAAAARAADTEAQIRANDALLAGMKSQVATRQEQLRKTAKALSALGERDSLKTQLLFYRSFWMDVQKSIESAAATSEDAAEAAAKPPGGME